MNVRNAETNKRVHDTYQAVVRWVCGRWLTTPCRRCKRRSTTRRWQRRQQSSSVRPRRDVDAAAAAAAAAAGRRRRRRRCRPAPPTALNRGSTRADVLRSSEEGDSSSPSACRCRTPIGDDRPTVGWTRWWTPWSTGHTRRETAAV